MGRPRKVAAEVVDQTTGEQVAVEVTETARPDKLNRANRPKRIPIHGLRNKLTVHGQEAGWHYCIVNEDNVPTYLEAGYEHVPHAIKIGDRAINTAGQIGAKPSIKVGTSANGAPITGYVLRCPQDVYDEEMQLIQDEVDRKEATLRRSPKSSEGGMYGEVQIGRAPKSD